jgi:hypothetical protein
MEFQTKLSALADVIVRVPPLFMVDGLLRVGLPQGESNYYNPSFEVGNNDSNITERGLPPTIPDYTNAGLLYKVLEATVLKYIPPWLGKL